MDSTTNGELMQPNVNPDIANYINNTSSLIMVAVTTDCGQPNVFHDNIQTQIASMGKDIAMFNMCYSEDQMPFPRIATDVLYYFAPKNQTVLFYRVGQHATIDLAGDIEAAFKMINGVSYLEAKFDVKMQEQILKTEDYIKNEDVSQFPSTFQMARNAAKDMWKMGKNAAKGLPVLVSAEEGFSRMNTCEGCDKFDAASSRCKECGCFMKTKTQLASASCPLGKWSAIV